MLLDVLARANTTKSRTANNCCDILFLSLPDWSNMPAENKPSAIITTAKGVRNPKFDCNP